MLRLLRVVIGVAVCCANVLLAQTAFGDASRGEKLLRERGCVGCHKVDGEGGSAAPDLGKRTSRDYTPAYVAGVLWNHAVSGSAERGMAAFSENEAADLFAFFASRRFFEEPGDARRGKQVFFEKRCDACHGTADGVSGEASPIAAWGSLRDPIGFAQEMWNRSPAMLQAFARKQVGHPHLTSQELNDLLVYLENLPAIRNRESHFRLAPAEMGRALFQAKGCAGCHRGKLSLENRMPRSTMADFSAAMWNHPLTNVQTRPSLSYNEMSALVGYLWSLEDRGDRYLGRIVFARKKCDTCHDTAATSTDGGASGESQGATAAGLGSLRRLHEGW